MADEVYEHLTFDDAVHVPISTLPGMAERTVTIGSAGKSFSFTGWKVGWATGPAPLVAAVRTAKQFLTYVASGPFQYAAAVGLALPDQYFADVRADLQRKRDRLADGLERVGLEVFRPQGTYFISVDIRSVGEEDGMAFCRSLPERCGVVAVPNVVFYDDLEAGRPLVRFAFCKRMSVLEEAVERLAGLGVRRRSVMRIAAIQHDIVWEDSAATRRHVEPMVAGAVASGAGLVVLTEMFATGFSMEADRIAEPEGGPTSTWIQEQAASHGVWLYGSVAERPAAGGKPRNVGVLAGPDGTTHRYAKLHPFTFARRARGLRRRRGDGHRRGRRAPGQPLHLLRPALRRRLVAAGPGHRPLPRAAPTGRRPGGPTGRPSSRPGPSRTRRTCSASTASARAAA